MITKQMMCTFDRRFFWCEVCNYYIDIEHNNFFSNSLFSCALDKFIYVLYLFLCSGLLIIISCFKCLKLLSSQEYFFSCSVAFSLSLEWNQHSSLCYFCQFIAYIKYMKIHALKILFHHVTFLSWLLFAYFYRLLLCDLPHPEFCSLMWSLL